MSEETEQGSPARGRSRVVRRVAVGGLLTAALVAGGYGIASAASSTPSPSPSSPSRSTPAHPNGPCPHMGGSSGGGYSGSGYNA